MIPRKSDDYEKGYENGKEAQHRIYMRELRYADQTIQDMRADCELAREYKRRAENAERLLDVLCPLIERGEFKAAQEYLEHLTMAVQ